MFARMICIVLLCIPGLALAGPPMSRTIEGDFADIVFDLENAIVNQGLVVDWVSRVGEMLDRTKDSVDGATPLYLNADVYNFCSAQLSRLAMQADPSNIQNCPYAVFIYEHTDAPGQIVIGHRVYDGDSMAEVNALLDAIVIEVAGE